jgi:hypothetical protein
MSIFYPKLLSLFNFNTQQQSRLTLARQLSKSFNFDPRALKTTQNPELWGQS